MGCGEAGERCGDPSRPKTLQIASLFVAALDPIQPVIGAPLRRGRSKRLRRYRNRISPG